MNKIKSVTVTNLFGYDGNDYTVYFSTKNPSFIYGTNGVGKTTLLKMLENLITENFPELFKIKFDIFSIDFENDDKLIVYSEEQQILYKIKTKDGEGKEIFLNYKEIKKNQMQIIQNFNVDSLYVCEHYGELKSKIELSGKDKNQIKTECELLEEVINQRSRISNKLIHVNQETGKITVKASYGIQKELKPIDLEWLTASERNLLMLYSHIIFKKTNEDSKDILNLDLIDEPELSIAPDALIPFIDNLEYINSKLGRTENYQYLFITQSPAITYNHNEMMFEMWRDPEVEKNNG